MSRLLAADGPKSGFGTIGHVLPSEGPVTELKAGVLRRHRERLKMPHTGHCPELVGALRAEKERPFTLNAAAIR